MLESGSNLKKGLKYVYICMSCAIRRQKFQKFNAFEQI